MSFTYDPTTQLGMVRLLIADTDSTTPIFQDAEIQAAFVIDSIVIFNPGSQGIATTYGQPSIRRAAAVLLDALASNKARLAAALKVLDIEMDGSNAAAALRAQADALRQAENDSGSFAIAEQVLDGFTMRERWEKQFLRGISL